MASPWKEKVVKCPFYRNAEGKRIICEGVISRTTTHISFEAPTDKKNYFKNLCCSIKGCKVCPIHKMLDGEYEDE